MGLQRTKTLKYDNVCNAKYYTKLSKGGCGFDSHHHCLRDKTPQPCDATLSFFRSGVKICRLLQVGGGA